MRKQREEGEQEADGLQRDQDLVGDRRRDAMTSKGVEKRGDMVICIMFPKDLSCTCEEDRL